MSIATSDLSDFDTAAPTNGQVPKWDSTSSKWVPSADSDSGTVTSVGITNTNGLTVSGSPITSSGSISVGLSTATQNTLSLVATNATSIATNVTNIASNVTDIALRAPIASPVFTGTATIPSLAATNFKLGTVATSGYVLKN